MIEMIRGAAELDGSWFSGGPVCSPLEQIAIYRTQYGLRLYDALREELIGLAHLIDADPEHNERGEALLRRFLFERPSSSWTLNRVADGLADWMAEQPDVPVPWIEMARLDWAVQHGFEAAESPPLDPADLQLALSGSGLALALQPHVHLVRARHNVHEIRGAVLGRAPVPELRQGDFPLVVFRRGIHMRHWCVPLGMWGILDAIASGASLPEALDRAFQRGFTTVEELTTEVGRWFRDLAERDIVTTRP